MTLYFHLSWRSQSISGIWRFICPIKVHLVLRVLNVKESEGFKFSICIKVFLYILVLHLYEGFSICLVWYLYEGLFLYLYLRYFLYYMFLYLYLRLFLYYMFLIFIFKVVTSGNALPWSFVCLLFSRDHSADQTPNAFLQYSKTFAVMKFILFARPNT